MSDASARPATLADLATLQRLADLARAERLTERGGAPLEELEPRPALDADRVESATDLVLVGEWGGVTFGFAHASLGPGTIATLHDLYVEPPARGVGIGEALMDAVLEWAIANHRSAIDSVVLPGNREGKNFFERYGLVTRALRVYRRLGDG
jgi:GNAT superfamily N-acetyltransferase